MSNYTVRIVLDDTGKEKKTSSSQTSKKTKTGIPLVDKTIGSNNLNFAAAAGAALSTASVVNGIVGNYTERRLRQRKTEVGLMFLCYAAAIAVNPYAIIGIAAIEGKRVLDYNIRIEKENMKSNYLRELSGNTTTSGNRWRGAR